jgi:hypothetical protein
MGFHTLWTNLVYRRRFTGCSQLQRPASMIDHTSYYALRRRPGVIADAWFSAIRWRADVPDALSAIVAGRGRVELTHDEAVEALEWAERVDGADVLTVYPHDPRGAAQTSAGPHAVSPRAPGSVPSSPRHER